MNNEMITNIRNKGIAVLFPNGMPSNLIQIDNAKWVFRVDDEHWMDMSFTVKAETFSPDSHVWTYTRKVEAAAERKAKQEATRKAKAEAEAEATRKAKTE